MANVKLAATGDVQRVSLDTTGQFNLGEAHPAFVGSWILGVPATASMGSLTLRKKLRRSSVTDANAPTCAYENHATGASVTAGTAITSTGAAQLIKVQCDGCDLILDFTSGTNAMVLECVPVAG